MISSKIIFHLKISYLYYLFPDANNFPGKIYYVLCSAVGITCHRLKIWQCHFAVKLLLALFLSPLRIIGNCQLSKLSRSSLSFACKNICGEKYQNFFWKVIKENSYRSNWKYLWSMANTFRKVSKCVCNNNKRSAVK